MDGKSHSNSQKANENTAASNLLLDRNIQNRIIVPLRAKILKMCQIWSKDFCPCFQNIMFDELTTLMDRLLDNFSHPHVETQQEKQKIIKDLKGEFESFPLYF